MNKIFHDSETPAKGQQVITACAFIHEQFGGVEKVFLPKRAATKKFLPDVYELPGGHIEFGEDIIVGLKREIKEEFGVKIQVGDPFAVFTYTNDIKGAHAVEIVYFATFAKPLENITLQPEDHSSYDWFTKEEILLRVVDANKSDTDDEIQAIDKGFAILEGEPLDTAL